MQALMIASALFVITLGGCALRADGSRDTVLGHYYQGSTLTAECGGNQGTLDGGAGRTEVGLGHDWHPVTKTYPDYDRDYGGWMCAGGVEVHLGYNPKPYKPRCEPACGVRDVAVDPAPLVERSTPKD